MRILPGLLLAAVTLSAQDAAEAHLNAAKAAAGTDWGNFFNFQCYGPGPGGQRPVPGAPKPAAPPAGAARGGGAPKQAGPPPRESWYREPAKVFDNLYWFGQSEYAAWVLATSEGFIVIDTLFDYSVQAEVEEGMQKLGLDPKNIKYVIVTHPHPDHDGGAQFLQEKYKARVIMSPADWDVLDKRTNGSKPKRDIEATDGMKVTLGDTTVTLYITPGHTPGTLSAIYPVKDNGTQHLVAEWGGAGLNQDKATVQQYIDSNKRFSAIVKQSGADVVLANHTDWDGSKVYVPQLAKRTPGMVNPYIVGNAKVLNYLKVAEECATSRIQ